MTSFLAKILENGNFLKEKQSWSEYGAIFLKEEDNHIGIQVFT